MNTRVVSHFFVAFGFSLLATVALFGAVGFALGVDGLVAMLILSALEITFSLDNAVVNAHVLQRMDAFWRRMFMTVGILVAVFGMRLVLPIVLVAITAHVSLGEVVTLALHHPTEYAHHLEQAHPIIASFGGMFLLMVFLDYLFGKAKNVVEALHRSHFKHAGRYIELLITTLALTFAYWIAAPSLQAIVLIAGLLGMAVFLGVRAVSDWVSNSTIVTGKGIGTRAGLVLFLYLEILDASFSFDGVIGAFAITSNVLLIAAGLGAGAVWVRSITVQLVRHEALARYIYLNAGAHTAIATLATALLVSIKYDVPDVVTGGVGLTIIVISFLASVRHNRRAGKIDALLHRA